VREPRRWPARAALCLTVAALGAQQLRFAPTIYAAQSRTVAEFLAGLAPIAPGERVVAQRAERARSNRFVLSASDVTRHAASWRAAESDAVDLGVHFHYYRTAPVRLREPLRRFAYQLSAYSAGSDLPLAEAAGFADLVYFWGFTPEELAERTAGAEVELRTSAARSALYELRP